MNVLFHQSISLYYPYLAAGKYYYDLELVNTSQSTVTRLLEGVARVTPEVTR